MERKLILATHGHFAEGIKSSLELICGATQNVETICAYIDDTFDMTQTAEKIVTDNQDKELLVITDILGGSVNNEFFKYIEQSNVYLVSGLNLPLLIELYTQLEEAESLDTLIKQVLSNSKEMIQYCNLLVAKEAEEEF